MSYYAKSGSFSKSTNTSTPVDQQVTGLGFQPKALILFYTPQTAGGNNNNGIGGIGMSDGTDDYAVCFSTDDNADPMVADRRNAAKVCTIIDSTGALEAEADLKSFDSDGFTLTWTTNNSSAYNLHYLALGGTEITNVKLNTQACPTSTGNQDITTGFNMTGGDVMVLLLHAYLTAVPSGSAHGEVGISAIVPSSTQRYMTACAADAEATAIDHTTAGTTGVLAFQGFKGGTWGGDGSMYFSSWLSNGYRLFYNGAPSAAFYFASLSIKGGQYSLSTETSKTSTTGTKDHTAPGFEPAAIFTWAEYSARADANLAIGATGGQDGDSIRFVDEDAATRSDNYMRNNADQCVTIGRENAITLAEAKFSSWLSAGVQLNWTTVDSSAHNFYMLAMGSAEVAALASQRLKVGHGR